MFQVKLVTLRKLIKTELILRKRQQKLLSLWCLKSLRKNMTKRLGSLLGVTRKVLKILRMKILHLHINDLLSQYKLLGFSAVYSMIENNNASVEEY